MLDKDGQNDGQDDVVLGYVLLAVWMRHFAHLCKSGQQSFIVGILTVDVTLEC